MGTPVAYEVSGTAAPEVRRAAARDWRPGWEADRRGLLAALEVLRFGYGDPAFQTAADGAVWRVSRTPAGPGTLRIAPAPADGVVRAHAWGPGADWLLDRLPALLGADDDPSGFDPSAHPVLRDAHRRHPQLRIGRTGLVMESLVPAVLGQRVTVGEAHRAWQYLLRQHGGPAPLPPPGSAPGPVPDGLRVAPAARDWALVPSWSWHRAGVDGQRSATAVRAARLAARLERASVLPPAEASALLRSVPGIGVWTVAETVQRCNGDADAVTVGDLHLPNTVGWALAGRERTDDAGMLDLLRPYAGHRHRVCRLIRLIAVRAPRHAPRYAPHDFRRM
ncbi:DNA-3-methyladenine glycosylase [Streptacidiphilus sp. PB12-B1b]|uniref:DNA-3-methyladenine glycosylase family protein n=1 Tax=Streptacidiphilus sp. PB12-B1b TaxID=2705012 RepID=UPI001CDB90E8|nr:DNA-3-methyladenine glycosylase 2 family protein [Streptacidiphilus sp. PB12-B1b]